MAIKRKSVPGNQDFDKLEKAYERYRDNLVAGPSTKPSMPGNWRNPMVNELNVIPRKPTKPSSGGGSRPKIDGVGRGGGIRIGTRRGIGER